MRSALLLLLLTVPALAKDHQWVPAKVLKAVTVDAGTSAAVVPIGTALYGVSTPQTASFYSIQVGEIKYAIHNYSEGAMVRRWLVLTVGGDIEAYVDGKFIHVRDTEGKDRKCKILSQAVADH